MQKIIKFLTSKTFIISIAILVLGLSIWFIGPLLAFDNLRPLETIGMRVTVMVLILALLLFTLAKLPVSIIGITSLAILIWHAGPLFKLGGLTPLKSETSRVLTIALLIFLYLLWGAYRLWRIMQNDPKVLDTVLNFGRRNAPELPVEVDGNLKEIGGIIGRAINQLKHMRTQVSGIQRIFRGRHYLYEVPWYMIIGNPGAGKTTALVNSGLKFPLAEQMGSVALRGETGTANCTWWLTNQAVLIDTAGRYANHGEGGASPEHNRAEWRGFLELLRKQRPRAPINGALITINIAELLGKTEPERIKLAADLRARLGELREILGIWFPVYVIVTKMDLLAGFETYFSTLTTEGRNQVWGFTLPYAKELVASGNTEGDESLKSYCSEQLEQLVKRLDSGINVRFNEEFDVEQRRNLALLPEEFSALIEPLTTTIEHIFLDSRYDGTQIRPPLRGVYFTSGAQAPASLIADRHTLWQRINLAFSGKHQEQENAAAERVNSTGNRSYFLHDLLSRLIFSESHLVRPNLRWEIRFRLLRIVGHSLVIILFVWLFSGVLVSSDNNRSYLASISDKTTHLTQLFKTFYASPNQQEIPDLLDQTRNLATYRELNPESPGGAWRYGLYSAPQILSATHSTYTSLNQTLLLPIIVRRMEDVLEQALQANDEEQVYKTLRAYLMLHDKTHYKAAEVRNWAITDWQNSDDTLTFGGQASVVDHIQHLFSDQRLVQSPLPLNDSLVARARAFLDGKTSLTRIYERMKYSMESFAPESFSLVKALGPMAGTVFMRNSGASLDHGVPGLFTYHGYHEVFQKKLPESLQAVYEEDAWVMGYAMGGENAQKKSLEELAKRFDRNGDIANQVRRLYLEEYTEYWEDFLDDVTSIPSATRTLNLQMLRQFAAPDSPLLRLGRAVVRETTLTRPLENSSDDKSLLAKAQEELSKKASETAEKLGLRSEVRLERELVDDHFAALREMVTGESDPALQKTGGIQSSFETLNGLINEYYTYLVIADNALNSGAIPPPGEIGSRLLIESGKLPAPFQRVLHDLVAEASYNLNEGIGEILMTKTEASVGDFCRRFIEGRYPLVASSQEIDIEDFERFFSAGGMMDDFFQKNLAAYADTTTKPWRYRQTGADSPQVLGPSLQSFYQAAQIRDLFFRDATGKKILWKADIRVNELDPHITDLILNIDGQVLRYIHGPVMPWHVTWPGPRGGTQAEIIANPRIRPETSTRMARGPWAVFRLLESGQVVASGSYNRSTVEYDFDGRRAILDINAGNHSNPVTSPALRNFKCPGGRY